MQAQSVSIRQRPRVSKKVRDRIVIEHLPLVKAIAIRVHGNLPVHVDVDDLIHAGVLGLFDAVEKFDASKNVAFQGYAKHRIKGSILDSLRQLDWASRDMRKRQSCYCGLFVRNDESGFRFYVRQDEPLGTRCK